ncbi:MAG: hypothetical protein ACRDH5_04745 [bacterium]
MRQYTPATARQDALDRNPVTIIAGDFSSVGGGLTVTLADYTVPAGRRVLLGAHLMGLVVTTALAAAQQAHIQTRITRFGGVATLLAQLTAQAAAAIGTRVDYTTGEIHLRAGDRIAAEVVTDAGAGVVRAAGGFTGVEYAA